MITYRKTNGLSSVLKAFFKINQSTLIDTVFPYMNHLTLELPM